MGCELVSDSLTSIEGSGGNRAAPPYAYTEKFVELFPYYISIGMTEEQYWDKDCTLVVSYRKAEEIRLNRVNQECFLQGAYIYESLCRVSPILHAFAKKGTKPKPYLTEPYPLNSKKEPTEKEEEVKAKKTYNKGMAFMARFVADTNKKFKGGGENV